MVLFAAIVIALTPFHAMAQVDDIQLFEVPAEGYSGTDTLFAGQRWNEYAVTVPKNHELSLTFRVNGHDKIMVYLIPRDDPTRIEYYTTGPVSEYTARVPAVIGFDKEYSIFVNTSWPGDVEYTVSITMEAEEHPEYMLYYALIVMGFVALVALSYKFVVWQEKREMEEKKKRRRKGKGRV